MAIKFYIQVDTMGDQYDVLHLSEDPDVRFEEWRRYLFVRLGKMPTDETCNQIAMGLGLKELMH